MRNLDEKINNAAIALATEAIESEIESYTQANGENLIFNLGKIAVLNDLAATSQVQTIIQLQKIRDTKAYRSKGFMQFKDFLNNSEFSPMNYNKFNRLEGLLKDEGETLFNTFNSLDVTPRVRKLLAAGSLQDIEIEGEKITIAGQTEDLSNKRVVKLVLESLVDEQQRMLKRLDKGEADNKRRKQQIIDLENKLNENVQITKQTQLDKSAQISLGGLAALANELQNAAHNDCINFAENSLKLIATQYKRLNEILAEKLDVTELPATDNEENLAALLAD